MRKNVLLSSQKDLSFAPKNISKLFQMYTILQCLLIPQHSAKSSDQSMIILIQAVLFFDANWNKHTIVLSFGYSKNKLQNTSFKIKEAGYI